LDKSSIGIRDENGAETFRLFCGKREMETKMEFCGTETEMEFF
jgi:hypothetical protein